MVGFILGALGSDREMAMKPAVQPAPHTLWSVPLRPPGPSLSVIPSLGQASRSLFIRAPLSRAHAAVCLVSKNHRE